MRASDRWQRWVPTSKVTAVGITGVVYTWGTWILTHYYELAIGPVELTATQTWVTFLIAYAVTEHRP